MSENLPKETAELQQPVVSEIRDLRLPIGASLLIRMHEVSDLSIRDLRYLMGDRRAQFRISHRQFEPEAAPISESPNIASKIERPPGFQLVRLLELFCRRKTIDNLVEPAHAEWLVEYYEAIKKKNYAIAWSIKIRMHFWILITVLGKDAISLIGKCVNLPFKAKSDD
jgi:hypothetical protein